MPLTPQDSWVKGALPSPLVTAQGKEFIRIGYYVNHEYLDEALREEPPKVPIIEKLSRSILADHPRVTRFPNDFDSPPEPELCEEEGQQGMQVGQAHGRVALARLVYAGLARPCCGCAHPLMGLDQPIPASQPSRRVPCMNEGSLPSPLVCTGAAFNPSTQQADSVTPVFMLSPLTGSTWIPSYSKGPCGL